MSSTADSASAVSNGTSDGSDESTPINVTGLASIIVFYLAVLAVGVWAGWVRRKAAK